jgi:hypothetical protein
VDGTCPTRWEYDSRYDRNFGSVYTLDGEDLPPWTPGLNALDAIDAVNALDAARQTGYFLGRPLDQYGTPVAREFGYKDDSCFIPSSEGHIQPQLGAPGTLGYSARLPTSNALFIFDKHSRHSRSSTVVPSLLSQCEFSQCHWLG